MNGLYCNHQYFITMGQHVGLDENLARGMFIEFKSLMPSVISQIKSLLPNHHPLHISDAIFSGLAKQAKKIPDF